MKCCVKPIYIRDYLYGNDISGFTPSQLTGFKWWLDPADESVNTYSESGGKQYCDETLLKTALTDSFIQATLSRRPEYALAAQNGKNTFFADTSGQVYPYANSTCFAGGNGTLAFGCQWNSGNTLIIEATATGAAYNFQVFESGGNFRIYTDTDGSQIITASDTDFHVWVFAKTGTSMKIYQDGVLINTLTINQNMNTARFLTIWGYQGLVGTEQGYGTFLDVVNCNVEIPIEEVTSFTTYMQTKWAI